MGSTFDLELTDSEMHREDRSVLALALDFPANPYDPFLAGGGVRARYPSCWLRKGSGISMLTFSPSNSSNSVPEHPFCRRIDAVYPAGTVDRQDSIDGKMPKSPAAWLALIFRFWFHPTASQFSNPAPA